MADRYRAYTTGTASRSHVQSGPQGPILDRNGQARRVATQWPSEEVAFEGELKNNSAQIKAGEITISRVVFYEGEPDEERVVGSIAVNQSGTFTATFEPPADEGDEAEEG